MFVEYKQGMTTVWSDGEKVVVTNPNGNSHIRANVENIFGMGEFTNLDSVRYSMHLDGKSYEMISGYIPQRVKDDLLEQQEKNLPGVSAKDIMGKYFEEKT